MQGNYDTCSAVDTSQINEDDKKGPWCYRWFEELEEDFNPGGCLTKSDHKIFTGKKVNQIRRCSMDFFRVFQHSMPAFIDTLSAAKVLYDVSPFVLHNDADKIALDFIGACELGGCAFANPRQGRLNNPKAAMKLISYIADVELIAA